MRPPAVAQPGAGRVRFGARLERADRFAIALLVVLPIALYVPFSLAGHPVVPGDDLFQNEPLRALSGQIIASGRLPAWDPLLWSGTPLLAGWNAGAMFPGTWLFAFLPGVAAWTVNFAAAPLIAGTGMYVFIRQLGCRPLGAALGALVFAYTGFLSGQIVHIGLEQGSAIVPWILVGLGLLLGARTRAGIAAAIALTGSAMALVVLAGDPRAVSSAAIIVVVDFLGRLCGRVNRRRLVLGMLASGLLGVALAGAQWWPGISFLHSSQRASAVYSFFSSGSLNWHALFSNLLVPFLVGGNGNFGLPDYAGNYNLPELTIGAGLVALSAAVVYLPEVLWRLTAWRRPGAPGARRITVFYVLGLIGTVLTLGSNTPLGHLLVKLPLYGGERLQNRNAAIFDLALAVLVAYFVDDLARGRSPLVARDAAAPEDPAGPRRWSLEGAQVLRLAAALPCLAAIVLVVLALADPHQLAHTLSLGSPGTFAGLAPYLVASAIFAALVVVFLLGIARLPPRHRTVLVALFVVCDVATYVLNSSFTTVPAAVLATRTSLSDALAAKIGPNGRFAFYNGAQLTNLGDSPTARLSLGLPDLNAIHDEPSVQGYGSIVNGTYQDVTQTHLFGSLDAGRLNGETFDTLDLHTLVAPLPYLGEELAPNAGVPVTISPHHTRSGPGITPPPSDFAGPWAISTGHVAPFLLPAASALARVTVILDRSRAPEPATLALTLGGAGTVVHLTRPVHDDQAVFRVASRAVMTTITVAGGGRDGAKVGAVVVVTANPSVRLLLDGTLQGTMSPPHWTYAGTLGGFTLFTNHDTRGFAWLQGAATTTPNVTAASPGSVRLVVHSPIAAQVMIVHASAPVQLVRSEGYSPGWTASVTPLSGGPTVIASVHRFGLVQAVALPAGNYRITFRYAPVSLLEGVVSSLAGFIVLLGLIAVALLRRRGADAPSGHLDEARVGATT